MNNLIQFPPLKQERQFKETGWKAVKSEIADLRKEAKLDCKAFCEISAKHTEELISALPFFLYPAALGLEADGTLLLEWLKMKGDKATMVSIICTEDCYIFSFREAGKIGNNGTTAYHSDSIDNFTRFLNRHFALDMSMNPEISRLAF